MRSMGCLVPEDFALDQLKNDAERRVVRELVEQLTDDWLVMPDVALTGQRDRQIDVVLAHPREGIAIVEVKGHHPKIRDGQWCSDGRPMDPQPFDQARDNTYALRDLLRRTHPDLTRVDVEYAVAFPNVGAISGALPTGVHPTQVLTGTTLDDAREAIELLMTHRRWNHPISSDAFAAIVATLRPDADFSVDVDAQARRSRMRLERICGQHVRVLERLDANRRVVVTGSAGTGKTRLVVAWAIRALNRGERVLVACYNDPLGDALADRLPDNDRLRVGSFFQIARDLDGMPPIDEPSDADADFWDLTVVGHLQRNWSHVTEHFDTVIIDEAQDLSPAWLAQLTQLLDPDGPRRVLMVADESQHVYDRGFTLPASDDGWVRCELVSNCRNTFEIAQLVRRHLHGAPPPAGGPEGFGVRWLAADDLETAIACVGAEVDRLDDDGVDASRVLFGTFTSMVRDVVRERLAMVSWEGGSPHAIVCENVHRIKGLEYDHVVLIAMPDHKVKDHLLYVGCSRAISSLTIIGPASVAQRLGLTPSDPVSTGASPG